MTLPVVVLLLYFSSATSLEDQRPWYIPIVEYLEPLLEKVPTLNCSSECETTADCPTGLSCFHATANKRGCCLMALKPNETGCVLDEQCKRACESTVCDLTQSPSRCLCEKGRHFLFNKCWKSCPEFAFPEPEIDASGFSICKLRTDLRDAVNYMRRMKRQLRSNFC